MSVLTPTLFQVWFFTHVHMRCFKSPAPALVVPCTPMPMVTSMCQMAGYQVCSHPASECLVDHVWHGMCPSVITFGEPTISGGISIIDSEDPLATFVALEWRNPSPYHS